MSADVIIVGAGVVGAATAFHLGLAGAGEVLVLDRATVGSGMSCRSSALIRMHYTFAPEVELAVRSDAMFDAWPELTGRPSCVRRTGFARIVSPGEENALRANVAMQQALGARAEIIDAAQLTDVAPGLYTGDIGYAAWEPHGGYGDGAVVAGDLLTAARQHGVAYQPHTTVSALIRRGDRVTGVHTPDGPRHAGTVVLAAGVWSPPLLAAAHISLPIETELHRVAVLVHPPGHGAPIACIDSTTQAYFRPEAGHTQTLAGTFTGPRGADPDTIPPTAPTHELIPVVQAAAHRVPALADAGLAHGITGLYDMTPDARPLLGPLDGLDGLIIAAGLSGMGFKIAPATGESLAALITGARSGNIDITPFRPDRFAQGQPIQPPNPYSDD